MFSLTFKGRINSWFQGFLVDYFHAWDQLVEEFLITFWDYDYDILCKQINNLQREENESLEDFSLRFEQMCHWFPLGDKPSTYDHIKWSIYLLTHYENQDQSIDDEPQSSQFDDPCTLIHSHHLDESTLLTK